MEDIIVLKKIESDILRIKSLVTMGDVELISKHYSDLKGKLITLEKVSQNSNSFIPDAVSDILHKSFSARRNTRNLSEISLCVADAHSYIDYYIGRLEDNS